MLDHRRVTLGWNSHVLGAFLAVRPGDRHETSNRFRLKTITKISCLMLFYLVCLTNLLHAGTANYLHTSFQIQQPSQMMVWTCQKLQYKTSRKCHIQLRPTSQRVKTVRKLTKLRKLRGLSASSSENSGSLSTSEGGGESLSFREI